MQLYLWIAVAVVAVGAAVGLLVLSSRLRAVRAQYAALTKGVDSGNLESLTTHAIDLVRQNAVTVAELRESVSIIERRLSGVFHGFGLVRFNAFQDVGGEQSFALALLNRTGDGLVISALHGRAETRIYAKIVEKAKSVYSLSDEEEQAVAQAVTRIRQMS